MQLGFPSGISGEEPVCQRRRQKRHGFHSLAGKSPWRRKWQPTPVFLPGESHGQESLVGYSLQVWRVRHDWSDLTHKEGAVIVPHAEKWAAGQFPCSSAGKESTSNARNPGPTPGSRRSAGEGIVYPPQYSWASMVAQLVKNPPAKRETWVPMWET